MAAGDRCTKRSRQDAAVKTGHRVETKLSCVVLRSFQSSGFLLDGCGSKAARSSSQCAKTRSPCFTGASPIERRSRPTLVQQAIGPGLWLGAGVGYRHDARVEQPEQEDMTRMLRSRRCSGQWHRAGSALGCVLSLGGLQDVHTDDLYPPYLGLTVRVRSAMPYAPER